MENKSNENLMENQNKCSNSIKKLLIPLAFHQIDFDWVVIFLRICMPYEMKFSINLLNLMRSIRITIKNRIY